MTTSSDDTIGLTDDTTAGPADGRLEPAAGQPGTSQPGASQPGASQRGAVPAERSVVAELRRQLRAERERSLNATDRVLGAQAEAAQARAEIKELYHRLHVRETELAQAKELLAERADPPAPLGGRAAREMAGRAGSAMRQLAERARSR